MSFRKLKFYIECGIISYTSLGSVYWLFFNQSVNGLLQLFFGDLLIIFLFVLIMLLQRPGSAAATG